MSALLAAGVAFLAAPAAAAPPVVQSDALKASPTGVRDVLANDRDPEAAALTISANSQPANGTASCSALGACLYTANGGFTGADAFTYTVRDAAGEESTATVTVTVSASTAQSALLARDDDVATIADRAQSFNVLDNDTGTGIAVTGNGDPQHGSVTCAADGECTYTPEAGYTGSDGFPYTIRESGGPSNRRNRGEEPPGGGRQATAAVHILVAPANTGYGLDVRGGPDPVAPGGKAQWALGILSVPEGISGQELRALELPSGVASLNGPHTLDSGSLQAARGWSSEVTGDGRLAYAAGDDALLGDAHTQTFPRPLPPISQGTGGDGHVPILVGTKVFAFYHHSDPTSVTCVDRATGSLCPGYPKRLDFGNDGNGFGTTDINGPAVVAGSKLYTHLENSGFYTQSASIGLFCWDAATDSTCGLTIVDRVPSGQDPGASAPVLAGGKMWFGGDTGKLYCVDPSDGAACGSLDTGLTPIAQIENYDAVAHGSRVFLARRGDKVSCLDVTAGAPCAGWEAPKSFGGNWNVVNQHDASGATVGVCVFNRNAGSCVRDSDPATLVPVNNFVNHDPYFQGYSHSLEGEAGTRTLVGSLSESGVGCYDWSTMAPCTGGSYAADGWLRTQSNGSALPYGTYGVAFDGSCGIALGDPGQVFTVDPAGSSPCLSLGSGTDRTAIDLRDQRCDGTVGTASWRTVTLSDTDDEEMESVVVTVRDAATQEILKAGEVVGGDQTLDLSGIDPVAHPAITIDATAKSASGSRAWDDGIPPRIRVAWKSDPQQACVRTTGDGACAASPSSIGLAGSLAAPNAAADEARLTLLRTPCPAAGGVLGTSQTQRRCAGKRRFNINVRYKGEDIRRLTVKVKGKKQKILRMSPRPRVRIDLRRFRRGTVVARITIVTKAGERLTGIRVYHPCTRKQPGRGFRY